jgi:hypothetical protein
LSGTNRWAGFELAQYVGVKIHSSCWNTFMANGRKRGPKTPWQNRAAYNRAKCELRLKPCQIENLAAADAFASGIGKRLNCFLTLKFSEIDAPLQAFRAGTKRLSQWHRHWGGALHWIYVWEATGGFHVHALVNVPRGLLQDFMQATTRAFAGHNLLLTHRSAGPSAMAYLCKGTDLQTHYALKSTSRIYAKAQGRIGWTRCGVSENIGKSARLKAGFDFSNGKNNCVKTYRRQSHTHKLPWLLMNERGQQLENPPPLVVLETTNSTAKMTGSAAHPTQALDGIGNKIQYSWTRAHGTGHEHLK